MTTKMSEAHELLCILRKNVNNIKIKQDQQQKELQSLKTKLEQEQHRLHVLREIHNTIRTTVSILYKNVSDNISTIITEGIKQVFPDSGLVFKLVFKEQRSTIEASIKLVDENDVEYTPIEDIGGGIVDFIALLLLIVYISLSRMDNVLFSDEPLKFVDKQALPDAVTFINKLCKDLDFQLVVVSHIPELVENADKIYKVTMCNNISNVEEIKK